MYKTICVVIALAFIGLSFKADNKTGINFNKNPWRDITKEAKEKHMPIFALVTAPWCPKCARMKQDVIISETVGEFYNKNFISVELDSEDPLTNVRVTNWGVTGVPALIFLNSDKKVVHMVQGFRDESRLIEEGKKALEEM